MGINLLLNNHWGGISSGWVAQQGGGGVSQPNRHSPLHPTSPIGCSLEGGNYGVPDLAIP